jgi:hypothetical protein
MKRVTMVALLIKFLLNESNSHCIIKYWKIFLKLFFIILLNIKKIIYFFKIYFLKNNIFQ